jgi:chromate transporter
MSAPAAEIPFATALRVWMRIGLESFGGPAGQIAVMHRVLVEERRWISEERFLHALSYCMLLPGPEAQQLATYVGWLLHRTRGGLAAGLLFVLPGFATILALSLLYAAYGDLPFVAAIFFGVKPAVLALVLEALLRISRRALKHRIHGWIAAAAFIALFLLRVPFPLVVLGAAAIGLALQRSVPGFVLELATASADGAPAAVDAVLDRATPAHTQPSLARALRVAALWGTLWAAPVALLFATLGGADVFTQIALFFSKMAAVTFGGAYAVLAYVAQQAVEHYGWLRAGEMLDGLGMAETTPGPLIQVVQFVGFLAAYRQPGVLTPWVAGTLAALLTTWVTYVPCFLWIFLGAPYIERLRGSRALRGALAAITAAIVGVILNLTVWFSMHVLFGSVRDVAVGPLLLQVPAWQTVDLAAVAIAIAAAIATLRFHVGIGALLGSAAITGLLWRFATGQLAT